MIEEGKDLYVDLISEILALEYPVHNKVIVTQHKCNRTELVLSNMGKENGILKIEISWKTKKVIRCAHFVPGTRIFDIQLVQPRLAQKDNYSNKDDERHILVFATCQIKRPGYVLIDLKRNTHLEVLSMLEAQKALSMRGLVTSQLPYVLINELYLGFRVVNFETEQVALRMRSPLGNDIAAGATVFVV